jgi:hypothetical protein
MMELSGLTDSLFSCGSGRGAASTTSVAHKKTPPPEINRTRLIRDIFMGLSLLRPARPWKEVTLSLL